MASISTVIEDQANSGLVKVTLTEFLDFLMASGSPRVTVVRDAKRRRDQKYDPRTDFYKPFRECVTRMHVNRQPKSDLDNMMEDLSDAKKQTNYDELSKGFKKFLGSREFVWYAPPRAEWTASGLTVVVNPELHVDIECVRHIVKIYLKICRIDKYKASIVNALIGIALDAPMNPAVLGVLCVRKGKLYPWAEPTPGLTELLEGEAATFVQIYGHV